MHGPFWLEDPTISIALIAAASVFLFLAIWRTSMYKSLDHYNVQPKVGRHKILDTGHGWIFFTLFIGLAAVAAHLLAEYTLHIYDITPVDKFTHGLSGMAITALILNFNLSRGRKVYYPTSIGVSWVAFITWEIYEWIMVMTNPNSGIETNMWDMAIDLWVDTLGALSICFIYDEFMKTKVESSTLPGGQGSTSKDSAA